MMSGHEYIVWINMMSGHGANPIFFNKKIKFGRPEHALTPRPPMSDNISFLPDPPPPPQSGRHICITSYVYISFAELSETAFRRCSSEYCNFAVYMYPSL